MFYPSRRGAPRTSAQINWSSGPPGRERPRPEPGHGGFTLIELLIVIAIISLLASILFPVFSRARENARRASCQTSMRFIALGIRQYVRDFDEKLPNVAGSNSPSASDPYGWADAVQPYAGGPNEFQCPSEQNPPPAAGASGIIWDQDHSCDYAYNSNVSGKPEAELTSSSTTIMLSENINVVPAVNRGDGRNSFGDVTGPSVMTTTTDNTRHLTGANYAFADGHMKFLLPSSVYGDGATPGLVAYTYAN